jgi:hypothetical protein
MMTIYYINNIKNKANTEINQYKQLINNIENEKQNTYNKTESSDDNKTNLMNNLPVRQLLDYRDRTILYDPLTAPERRVDMREYPLPIIREINIPTRGYQDSYQIVGLLSRSVDEKILQLFGRPTYPGSNQYEYYATTESNGFANKIPIETRGKREIEDGTSIKVPIFDESKGEFQVKLYNYNTPRYNPYIF